MNERISTFDPGEQNFFTQLFDNFCFESSFQEFLEFKTVLKLTRFDGLRVHRESFGLASQI